VYDLQLHGLTKLSLIQTVEEALSLEKKVINTATLSDPERFSEIPYSMEDCTEDPPKSVSGAKV
jgi:DNA-directed RNA polymerase III subunit RPC3